MTLQELYAVKPSFLAAFYRMRCEIGMPVGKYRYRHRCRYRFRDRWQIPLQIQIPKLRLSGFPPPTAP